METGRYASKTIENGFQSFSAKYPFDRAGNGVRMPKHKNIMKKTSPKNTDIFGNEYIHSFSRKQDIEQGVLINLSQFEEFSLMWGYDVACTHAVWDVIQTAICKDGCDLKEILRDISWEAHFIAKRQGDKTSFEFLVYIGRVIAFLTLHLGPGDTAEPVLTLMLSSET